ncbi:hypothetical protein NMBNZ0533_1407 [Neisseria meningitidis NZ-05/33]|nr:hypothetical protein NMBNZ0533_1407 [Neisseria meningitidis NZ-05/33]
MCKPNRKCEIPSENLSDGIYCLYCRFSSVSGFLFGAEQIGSQIAIEE